VPADQGFASLRFASTDRISSWIPNQLQ